MTKKILSFTLIFQVLFQFQSFNNAFSQDEIKYDKFTREFHKFINNHGLKSSNENADTFYEMRKKFFDEKENLSVNEYNDFVELVFNQFITNDFLSEDVSTDGKKIEHFNNFIALHKIIIDELNNTVSSVFNETSIKSELECEEDIKARSAWIGLSTSGLFLLAWGIIGNRGRGIIENSSKKFFIRGIKGTAHYGHKGIKHIIEGFISRFDKVTQERYRRNLVVLNLNFARSKSAT